MVKKGFPFVVNVYEKRVMMGKEYELLVSRESFKTLEAMNDQASKNTSMVYKVVNQI